MVHMAPSKDRLTLSELVDELNRRKSDNIKLAAPLDHETAKMLCFFCKPVARD